MKVVPIEGPAMTSSKSMSSRLLCVPAACIVLAVINGCAVSSRQAATQERSSLSVKLRQPRVCASFSGGGIRSAAFSIGVIQALHDANALEKFDIFTATSGGSWGLLWFYSHAATSDDLEEMFNEGSAALQRVDATPFMEPYWRGWTGFWSLLRAGTAAYYADLKAKFGASLFANASPQEVADAVTRHGLPVPIVTLAAAPRPCTPDGDAPRVRPQDIQSIPVEERAREFTPLSARVVEVSPEGWGNSSYGFSKQWPYQLDDFEHWAMVSGAVLDYPRVKSCKLMRSLGFSWGARLELTEATGFPKDSGSVFFADGGFAENLAAFPAISRGCDLAVIIDAEYDPSLQFDGYRILRTKLQVMGGSIAVAPIDERLSAQGGPESFSANDPSLDVVKHPLFTGVVRGITPDEQKLIYLKLTYDPESESSYDPVTVGWYRRSEKCRLEAKENSRCSFPHTPTSHTAYSLDEFRAHRELGRSLAEMHLVPALSAALASSE